MKQYGKVFPDGRVEWGKAGEWSTAEDRANEIASYQDVLRALGIVNPPMLGFVLREVTTTYGEAQPVPDEAPQVD